MSLTVRSVATTGVGTGWVWLLTTLLLIQLLLCVTVVLGRKVNCTDNTRTSSELRCRENTIDVAGSDYDTFNVDCSGSYVCQRSRIFILNNTSVDIGNIDCSAQYACESAEIHVYDYSDVSRFGFVDCSSPSSSSGLVGSCFGMKIFLYDHSTLKLKCGLNGCDENTEIFVFDQARFIVHPNSSSMTWWKYHMTRILPIKVHSIHSSNQINIESNGWKFDIDHHIPKIKSDNNNNLVPPSEVKTLSLHDDHMNQTTSEPKDDHQRSKSNGIVIAVVTSLLVFSFISIGAGAFFVYSRHRQRYPSVSDLQRAKRQRSSKSDSKKMKIMSINDEEKDHFTHLNLQPPNEPSALGMSSLSALDLALKRSAERDNPSEWMGKRSSTFVPDEDTSGEEEYYMENPRIETSE